MIFLALAVLCSVGIATMFNAAERRKLDRVALLTANYAAAALLAIVLNGLGSIPEIGAGLVILGAVQGVLFIGGFLLFSLAIREAGMGLAAGVMRLSVVVPVLASWAVWREVPSLWQGSGLFLAGCAFFLVARPAGLAKPSGRANIHGGSRTAMALCLLFIVGGSVDFLMKVFAEVYGPAVPQSLFLLFVFGVAFLVGLVWVIINGVRFGRWPRREALVWGSVLGLINYGSADFFLRAIALLEGPLVFPANSVAIVIGASLVGYFVWHERLSRVNMLGLGLAAFALILLSM